MTAILREKIRTVPDFPKKGILFRDITPVLNDPTCFQMLVDLFAERYRARNVNKVVAIESRGYLVGAPLAYALKAGLVIVRKPGKLPATVDRETYSLEYGTDTLEMHVDAIEPKERVVIIDDLLATGGTAEAAGKLVGRRRAELLEYAFIVELAGLKGRARLGADKVFALLDY
jgi:adenine phosphoribosyltransferase